MATALHELQSGCTFLRCSHNEEHGRSRGKLETTLSKLTDNCAWCTEFPITRLRWGLFVQIMTYLFGSTVEDVEERLNDFLELVRRYEDANGTDPVPDKVKKRVHDCFEDSDFARVMASSRHLTRFGDGPMSRSYICTTRVTGQNLEDMRKAHRRLHSWNRRMARAELRIDRANKRDQLPQTGSSATTQSWANGSWFQTERLWRGHWQYFGWGRSQDLWNPSEYHNWVWLP